jgi:hypothetical protein
MRRPPVSDDPHLTPARRAERAARHKRLAEALRANLHRRKEQARAREDGSAASDAASCDRDEER